jgi:3-oxoacyl-[acyl-carrier-protein] synthase II
VESDQYALFDAARALADDGAVRAFSIGRRGLLLGDGVVAAVIESADTARARRAPITAQIAGWGRSGDAYHPVRPRPDGSALAGAITAALCRAGISADDIGYVNPNGAGSKFGDPAEAAALRLALGDAGATVPVSSTKSLLGQALEAAGLIELLAVAGALRAGRLPVNAGYLGPDKECRLNLVLDEPAAVASRYALSLNVAFGGANTVLVVGAP